MTEQELRALVRAAIARHGMAAGSDPLAGSTSPAPGSARSHPSHGMFKLTTGGDGEGPCIIEPAVMCNHCGYCKSYGH